MTGESEAMTLEVAREAVKDWEAPEAMAGGEMRFLSHAHYLRAKGFIEGHAAGALQMREMALKIVISRGDENAPYYESRGLIAEAIRALPLEKP